MIMDKMREEGNEKKWKQKTGKWID
jgi:hypothetical protein